MIARKLVQLLKVPKMLEGQVNNYVEKITDEDLNRIWEVMQFVTSQEPEGVIDNVNPASARV